MNYRFEGKNMTYKTVQNSTQLEGRIKKSTFWPYLLGFLVLIAIKGVLECCNLLIHYPIMLHLFVTLCGFETCNLHFFRFLFWILHHELGSNKIQYQHWGWWIHPSLLFFFFFGIINFPFDHAWSWSFSNLLYFSIRSISLFMCSAEFLVRYFLNSKSIENPILNVLAAMPQWLPLISLYIS